MFMLTCQRKFSLGYGPLQGTDSVDLAQTTINILDRFCTKRGEPPNNYMNGNVPHGFLDTDLKAKIADAVEMLCTDAASDEFRAARLLSGR